MAKYRNVNNSPAPYFDLDKEYNLQQATYKLIINNHLQSCHDLSEGGLFVALFESAKYRGLGFEITTDKNFRTDSFLFGEAQSRILVSIRPENKTNFENELQKSEISFLLLGVVKGKDMLVDGTMIGSLKEFEGLYDHAIGNVIEGN